MMIWWVPSLQVRQKVREMRVTLDGGSPLSQARRVSEIQIPEFA